MDRTQNPFAPGAGTPPPELAGRDEMLENVVVTLDRLRLGKPIRSQIFVGLRGVGKTVLLNRVEGLAVERDFEVISFEAHTNKSLAALLIPPLRRVLFRLDTRENLSEKTKQALRVLRSFIGKFKAKLKVGEVGEIELGVDPAPGLADSGDLESDLPDLLFAVAEAAKERKACVCLIVDELQYVSQLEFSALIMALHRVSQRSLPLVMVASGLPLILGLAGRSKSYAERLFAFPTLGPLAPAEAILALQVPVQAMKAAFNSDALAALLEQTRGYPYFLQQWGYESWNVATKSPITAADVRRATARAIKQLDESFFRVRFDRLTKREKDYLFAMVAVGGEQQRSGDIAEMLGIKTSSLGPLRSALIGKGMIYSPAHGDNAFTVPLFGGFLQRQLASGG